MLESFLYMQVKARICRDIFYGVYKENECFPPERVMAEQLGVSRVTLRKALSSLEQEGIIVGIQGSGNYLRFRNTGYPGELDFVALISSTNQTFFNRFLAEFQKTADENKTMVLFLQKPHGFTLEECIYRIYEKNVHDVVVWPEDASLNENLIRRLRALGMNIVIFDSEICRPYVDCVYLDNEHAISTLYEYVRKQYGPRILYIGWDIHEMYSIKQRGDTVEAIAGDNAISLTVPWAQRSQVNLVVEELLKSNMGLLTRINAIICENAEINIATIQAMKYFHIDMPLVSIDDSAEAEEYSFTVYRQRVDLMANRVYECLAQQNRNSVEWKPKCFAVPGELITRN